MIWRAPNTSFSGLPAMMSEMSACVRVLATFSIAFAAISAASMPKLLVLNLICKTSQERAVLKV